MNNDIDLQTPDKAKIEEIIKIEWQMFQNVDNLGGRADCQDDFETFLIQVHICRTSHNANCIKENNIKLNIFSFYPLQTFLNYGIIILILQQRRCITEQKLCYITSFFV